ncbi:hypothetical protein [Kitasatospora cathayae]|uniref:Zinc ribbon domain-containing protein n=1 Tax=Kitasatospora cathayae TaxID=3004092 RepID=A0ABY7QGY7_9ACTN|nr:hypothetical protein [Kitasatospora sp. HUAS 3-15]WBP92000.1 hypothetical protein O1G21_40125 [Kitasatospora sp. HUAS 3-15]
MSSTLTVEQQLQLAVEFRVPIPQGPVGGYGEVVVRRDETGTGWAVTDGALVGLRAWIEGEDGGWRPVWDIGRAAAYQHTREYALALAHQVAEIEAANYQALLAVVADPLAHARARRYTITCPRCHTPGAEEYGEPARDSDDFADCARCHSCGLEWALDPGADASCTTCGGSGIPGAGPIGRRTPGGWEPAPTCGCREQHEEAGH